jgi:hypothetical protein
MKQLTTKRSGGIDLLKHLLAIFVIMQHMTSKSRYSEETNLFLGSIIEYINGAVIGFILISGFFFKPADKLKEGVFKIFKRTIIPFFVFSLFYTVLMFLLGKGSLASGFINTIKFHGASMQLYYLPYLFIIYCFYLLIFNMFSSNKGRLQYLLIFILFIFTIISLAYPTDSATGSSYKLLPIYFLSFGITVYLSILRKEDERKYLIITILISIISCLIGTYDYRFYHISVMIVLLLLFYFLSNNCSLLNRQFPGSGGVYLFHTPIINFGISTGLIYLNIFEKHNLFFSIILTYIVTLIISLLIIKISPRYRYFILE